MRVAGNVARGGALLVALCTFAVGLIAPLTPSDGYPRPIDVALFAGVPAALAMGVALSSSADGWRVTGWGLFCLVVVLTLEVSYGLP